MTDQEEQNVLHLTRAVKARVECKRHGEKHIRGSVDSYSLGYGNMRLEIGSWSECLRCGDDTSFLHLNVIVEETEPLDTAVLRDALMEDMQNATGNNDSEA